MKNNMSTLLDYFSDVHIIRTYQIRRNVKYAIKVFFYKTYAIKVNFIYLFL